MSGHWNGRICSSDKTQIYCLWTQFGADSGGVQFNARGGGWLQAQALSLSEEEPQDIEGSNGYFHFHGQGWDGC